MVRVCKKAFLRSPVAVDDLTEGCSRVGAELGPGPAVRATDMGAGREAFSGDGSEAFNVAGGLRAWFELSGSQSGVSAPFIVLVFTQGEEEDEEEEEAELP